MHFCIICNPSNDLHTMSFIYIALSLGVVTRDVMEIAYYVYVHCTDVTTKFLSKKMVLCMVKSSNIYQISCN